MRTSGIETRLNNLAYKNLFKNYWVSYEFMLDFIISTKQEIVFHYVLLKNIVLFHVILCLSITKRSGGRHYMYIDFLYWVIE